MRRYDAARANETGLEILTFPQLAERLAGGFARTAGGPLLYSAVDAALKLDGYADLESVKHLPGMPRAVAGTLTSGLECRCRPRRSRSWVRTVGGPRAASEAGSRGLARWCLDHPSAAIRRPFALLDRQAGFWLDDHGRDC
jgi:hypothetical protein